MEKSIDIILVVFGGPLPVHLAEVIEEMGVHSVEEPLLLRDGVLHQHKG